MIWTSADLAARLGGNGQLALELIDIFLAEYPRLLEAVRVSVEGREPLAIGRAAHALKGSVANFIESGPTATAGAIERAAAEARLDDAQTLLEQLEGELRDLAHAMRHYAGGV